MLFTLKRAAFVAIILTLFWVITSQAREDAKVGPLQTQTEVIKMDPVKSVEVDIDLGLGDLTITGGSNDIMTGKFEYNVVQWKPEIQYKTTGSRGEIKIKMPDVELDFDEDDKDIENNWMLQFNKDIPLEMKIEIGVGESELDFSNVTLSSLEISNGAGEVSVEIGQQEIDELEIESGAGEVEISFDGGNIDELEIDLGAGESVLDFTGNWKSDMDANIDCGVGEVTIRLPEDVGVRIKAGSNWLSEVNTKGLHKKGGAFVNDAYGSSNVTLEFSVDVGVGQLNLEVGGSEAY